MRRGGRVSGKRTNAEPLRASTLAGRQTGAGLLIAPLLAVSLVALPLSWHLPLFHTELLMFLENDVSLLGAVRTLAETDLFLCAIVVVFGMAIPVMKLAALLYAWSALPAERARAWIDAAGKLSKFAMLDVLLLALVIVGLKGVGMGKVTVAYGLYVYAAVVLLVLMVSAWMQWRATTD